MAEFDYKIEVDRLLLAARFLADVDTEGILRAIADADNVGWFLDPTAYMDALHRGDMDAIAEVARLAAPLRQAFREKIEPRLERVGG